MSKVIGKTGRFSPIDHADLPEVLRNRLVPLIKLNNLGVKDGVNIFAKLEWYS